MSLSFSRLSKFLIPPYPKISKNIFNINTEILDYIIIITIITLILMKNPKFTWRARVHLTIIENINLVYLAIHNWRTVYSLLFYNNILDKFKYYFYIYYILLVIIDLDPRLSITINSIYLTYYHTWVIISSAYTP